MLTAPRALARINQQPMAYRYILYSQAIFYTALVICLLLTPASLSANGGMSYFGTHRITVGPFVAGLLLSVYFLWRAYQQLGRSGHGLILKRAFSLIIPGMIGIAIAPAVGNGWLDALHRVFGTLVFVTELIIGFWMAYIVNRGLPNWLAFGLQLAGGLIAFIYLAPAKGFSIEGQILFQVGFSALLFHNLKRLLAEGTTAPAK